MTDAELRSKAVALAAAGDAMAAAVRRVLDERDGLRQRLLAMAERVADQSEVLTRSAEKGAGS